MTDKVRMVVQTTVGVIEGSWEAIPQRGDDIRVRAGVETALKNGDVLALATPEGPVVVPAHAVVYVRFETRSDT